MSKIRILVLAALLCLAGAMSPVRAEDVNPAASSFIQSLGSQAITELTGPNVPQHDREAR